MEYLIGAIVLLLGGFLYQKSKRESAEALNDNLEVKEDLLKKDKATTTNDALIDANNKQIEETESKKHEKVDNLYNLADFFGKRK